MNIISDIQLRKMSVTKLDSLVDSLYNEIYNLQSAIYDSWFSSSSANQEIKDIKSYIVNIK